jgi:serine/threonine protein kinase
MPERTERANDLIGGLPAPLAQLVRRSLDGKSAVERHNCAYYLGEASLKLAAALRIRLYLEHAVEPQGKVARRLVCLKLPSLGQWCELLRATNEELGALQDTHDVPLLRRSRELVKRPASWDGVVQLAEAVAEAGVLNRETARRAVSGGLLGFFELLTAYRNEVIGHGAQRSDAYCDTFAGLILDGMFDVLDSEALFDGLRMGRAVSSSTSESRVWQELTGLSANTTAFDASDLDPTQLYFRAPGHVISVHPLVVVREDDLGREQVGFLNRTLLRTRTIAHGLVEEVRRVDYLDYASGDTFSGIDTHEGMRELLERSRQEERGPSGLLEPVARGVVVGDFEVRESIGRGATGVVFAARQRSMNRIVALKVLEPSMVATSLQLRRFQREIAVLARCDHPNVVKVLTAGADQGRRFYAMEYVDGADLARLGRVLSAWRRDGLVLTEGHLPAAIALAQRVQGRGVEAEPSGALPSSADAKGRAMELRLAELFADAAQGLHHLHERGTVHRDVKPGNLMLTADASRMVVMDLGSARFVDETATLTRSGAGLAGTLRYMAPEQIDPKRGGIDGRADVFALAATLFEVVTGHRMFDGDNEGRIVQQVLGGRVVPLRALAPLAPASLEAVIERATRKRPEDRYPTARALAEDLRAVAAARPTVAKPQGPLGRSLSFARRHPVALSLVAGVVVFSGGAGAFAWRFFHPQSITHRHCVEHRGAFVGVGEIVEPTGRAKSCVVIRRAGKIQRVEWVNGLGQGVENDDGDAALDFVYAEAGALLERLHRRADGTIRQRHRFVWEGAIVNATVVDRNNYRLSLDGSEVTSYRVVFGVHGFPERRWFFNDRGQPRRNAKNVFGYSTTVDGHGLVTSRTSLAADGQRMPDEDGVTQVWWRHGQDWEPEERWFADMHGAPVEDRFGIGRLRWERDERGNPRVERRFDAAGSPARGADGCGGWRSEYDRAGAVVSWTCLGLGADAGLDWHRDGYVTRKAAYDGHGNRVEESYHDGSGAPIRHRDGYGKWRAVYDVRGYRVEQRFFDEVGAPCDHRDGYALWRAKHDDAGHIVQVAYFDSKERPTLHRDGVSSWRSTYDERGNLLSSSFYGVDGLPVLNRYGYGQRSFRHDDRDDIVELAYYGVDGLLRVGADGHARMKAEYDDRGRRVEQRYFDAAGAVARDARELVHGVRMQHDDQGRVVRRTMLGDDGQPGVSPEGIGVETIEYDGLQRVVKRSFFGLDGRLVGETRGDYRVAREVWVRLGAMRAARPDLFRGGGLVVAGVYRPSEGVDCGLEVGDVILQVGGQGIGDERDLWFVERSPASKDVVLIRGEKEIRLPVEGSVWKRMVFLG